MTSRARDLLTGPGDDPIITSARQAALMAAARQDLENARDSLRAGVTPDAFLSDAERAAATLGRFTGDTASADITTEIFARFCVGK
jgi:tRNA modification GTPase